MAHDDKKAESNPIPAAIARVSVKVPSFWKPDPKIWFIQLEAQFRNAGITSDQTKYDYVVSSIEADILTRVTDILLDPPQDDKYNAIKNRLISLYSETETQQIQKLLSEMELGDKKPSQLLCEMRNLAGTKVTDPFLKTLWLQRLPVNMRSILSVSSDDLSNLASMGDKIWELNPVSPQISNVISDGVDQNTIKSLQKQMSELTMEVSRISRNQQRGSFNRDRSKSRRRSNSYISENSNFCYYHRRFGEQSFKCIQPCEFQSKYKRNDSEN